MPFSLQHLQQKALVLSTFVEIQVGHSRCKQKMTSFRGQTCWAKMTSPGVKLTALACHPNKNVTKAGKLTYLTTNIGCYAALAPCTSFKYLHATEQHFAMPCKVETCSQEHSIGLLGHMLCSLFLMKLACALFINYDSIVRILDFYEIKPRKDTHKFT